MSRRKVELYDTDTLEEIARKLTTALAHVHERRAGVMVWFRGAPYAMIVPPDAGLAWERAQESERLSDIATVSAGLDPGRSVRVTGSGQVEVYPPETGPE